MKEAKKKPELMGQCKHRLEIRQIKLECVGQSSSNCIKFGIFLINPQLPRKLFKSLGLLPSQLAYGRFSVCLFLMRKHEAMAVSKQRS
jgi:hypothetical protein